ncbi:hypothetical protein BJY01DRAFT_146854 [Aspergillus pseudoustus]|uniref:Uncharacterized protein n=1 Tax=Aspergillus pseudoustus TaxID=1810923 RepID=A0ABR4KBS2_9EURO
MFPYIQTATNITYVDAVNTNNPITTTYLNSGYRMFAQPVSGWNIGPASTAASSTTTTTASPFSGLTTSNPDPGLSARDAIIGEENCSDGLSTGTTAGIAIGILVFVAAIVRVMVIAWRKNQKEKEKEEADKRPKDSGEKGQGKDQGPGQGQDVTELDGSNTLRSGPQELDGINRVEVSRGYQGQEMPHASSSRVAEDRAGGMVYELDADTASNPEYFNIVK